MSDLTKKLHITSGDRMAIINAPSGYLETLGQLPEGVELSQEAVGTYDFVQLFAHDSQELGHILPAGLRALKKDGRLWIAFPKKSSGLKTDLSRDSGWEALAEAGMRGVSLVSIDKTWSAMRCRPAEQKTSQDLVNDQYSGRKAALKHIYDRLLQETESFGSDIEIAPRKSYVALARKKQFAIIKASTNTRLDLGLKLKGLAAGDRLQDAGNFGSGSITHKVALTSVDEVDEELIEWLRSAYESVA